MNGTLRSWVHFLDLRCDEHTQKEHRLVAEQVKNILEVNFPTVYEAIYSQQLSLVERCVWDAEAAGAKPA